ncbi:helix-turn-helix domain-containing protein [Gulosibacter molinativorax]|uniref:AraC family transcriptional regulator n=1 Tax=Gulosibacter molinativorax TaxID=256821 RepID=A0ABT7C5P8_9MICO|nr:AraC family transcriptional regulator [Gulosibacter molinativorax]MDJ1370504.1 AraC family transcriptional regulator [Gulosibacter molinativorax]QUY62085.1 Virulence regulon transcriptional activator VirF [Gulosibacter molinativorax]
MVDRVKAWHPEVPSLREVYHANFDHAYPMHTHDDWAVMLVDRGAVSYRLDEGDHHAEPGSVTLLPPGIPHDGRSAVDGGGYRKRVLYLDQEWLPDAVTGMAVRRPTLAGPEALAAVRRIHSALEQPGDLLAAEHWLLNIHDKVLEHLGRPGDITRDVPLARRLRELLDDRLTESFTIAEAAAELGAHPSHLVRVFSQAYGIPPHQYLVGRRVDLARHLLAEGYRPADAAALAGFHDQAHLTRHFRRVLGITPSAIAAYRDRLAGHGTPTRASRSTRSSRGSSCPRK